jgi:hypothetical protein
MLNYSKGDKGLMGLTRAKKSWTERKESNHDKTSEQSAKENDTSYITCKYTACQSPVEDDYMLLKPLKLLKLVGGP